MKAVEVKKDIYWTGVKDWNLVDFHGHLTPHHTTYNSYVIMDEKITIVDGAKITLSDEMIERVKTVVDFSKVSYIVVNHVEMDHAGNLPELLKLAPQAKIITNLAAKMGLEEHFDTSSWEFIIIRTGDEISIGKRTLSFYPTPMLHWPDSMVTYCKEDKILFSNDAFGQHVCDNTIFASELPMDVVIAEAKRYYANILLPYGSQAEKALGVVEKLELDTIAPGHGCVLQGDEIKQMFAAYNEWDSVENKGSAVVVYDSMWHSTEKLAEAVKSAFDDLSIPVKKICLRDIHYSQAIIEIMDAKYVAVGTPTLNNEIYPSVVAFLTYMKGLNPKNKVGFAFNSFGWKDGVAAKVQDYFTALNWQTLEPFAIKYNPKCDGLNKIKEHLKKQIG
ncbi:MAG: FprA family A-type flavoprotein [Alphaproteobacteria bacterium]|nr:FprA family A-type flavoprotein [Alphaproteobacteria bacterium]